MLMLCGSRGTSEVLQTCGKYEHTVLELAIITQAEKAHVAGTVGLSGCGM
jgi:hypothetical protein